MALSEEKYHLTYVLYFEPRFSCHQQEILAVTRRGHGSWPATSGVFTLSRGPDVSALHGQSELFLRGGFPRTLSSAELEED